jgi:hypothetical protein
VILDGCLKMVDSYFPDNKLTKKINKPDNHPLNLDQTVYEGPGFQLYCKQFQFGDNETTMFLAYAFADYLIRTYGFKLYKDSEPEFPLRTLTLKYDKKGVVVSLYPIEYALKVLNHESKFEDLHTKLNAHLESLPSADDILKKHL